MSKEISKRKTDGIKLVAGKDVESRSTSTLFEHMQLVHSALPELNFEEIDTSTTFLGRTFSTPLLIDSMTGGSAEAQKVNKNLARSAEELGLPMGIGSQRAGLVAEDLIKSYSVARENAPSIFLIANIGAAQLAKGFTVDDAEKCVKMIKADAFVIHLNPLQEIVQPEGDSKYHGVLSKIQEFSSSLSVPVIVKEVGSGISKEVALKLQIAGVNAINVAGVGGTSWAGIERFRAVAQKEKLKAALGDIFWDWGIPTAASLIEVRRAVDLPLIASGGIRDGIDVAKALILGASLCGMAAPFLKCAVKSKEDVLNLIKTTIHILKTTMFLVGARNISELRTRRYILTGPLKDWANST